MRVLVTGGSGYVGSSAVRELAAAGHEILIYDNLSTGHPKLARGFELVRGDIADTEKLAACLRRVDAVMHFAASAYVGESVVHPRKYFHNNVESALALMDAVLASSVRLFVFSSTCATYGIPHALPIVEEHPQRPINPYGATKLFLKACSGPTLFRMDCASSRCVISMPPEPIRPARSARFTRRKRI